MKYFQSPKKVREQVDEFTKKTSKLNAYSKNLIEKERNHLADDINDFTSQSGTTESDNSNDGSPKDLHVSLPVRSPEEKSEILTPASPEVVDS